MQPKITEVLTDDNVLNFRLSGVNVSLANSIRRTIINDIPITVFITEKYIENKCEIQINTSRFHNEVVKQRLSCIPIITQNLDLLPDKYILEVDIENDTENIIYVTTEHFKIRNKANGNYMSQDEVQRIFPKNVITQSYIDFIRLRPQIADTISGERIKLTCDFSVATAKDNSMYNVVSKCAYFNTLDTVRAEEEWKKREDQYIKQNVLTPEEIKYEKKNFSILDAQRYFVENSFDFVIESIGIYENKFIVKNACQILQNKMVDFVKNLDSDIVPIHISDTSMENAFDIVLENEDYTIGKVIEYIIYATYYDIEPTNPNKILFCGFKKMHPHDTDSIIRLQLKPEFDKTTVKQIVRDSCITANNIYKDIFNNF